MPKKQLEDRLRLFHSGQWSELWASSTSNEAVAHQISSRRRRRPQRDQEKRRADRARSLVQMGELSAARGALEAALVALGTMATLAKLTDPERRPPLPREELCQEVVSSVPERFFELDPVEFGVSVRTARRWAEAGSSGMTADHLSTILDNEADSMLLVEASSRFGSRGCAIGVIKGLRLRFSGPPKSQACSRLAAGDVPTEIIEGLRLRLTALQNPNGGVRGLVVETLCAGWSQEPWRRKLRSMPRKPPLPSSTPCPRKQVVSALLTSCRVSQMWTAARPVCSLTWSGRTI